MNKIAKDKFLFLYQNEYGNLDLSQHSGLMAVLDLLEADDKITDIRHAAYILATIKHECAGKWKPIAEFGMGKGKKYGVPDKRTGKIYYGRGFVQTTWYDNYQALQSAWDKQHPDRPIDLLKNPDLLLLPEYSYFGTSYPMRVGMYTGKALRHYINGETCDYVNARRIINGTDCAEKIASYAAKIESILRESEIKEVA